MPQARAPRLNRTHYDPSPGLDRYRWGGERRPAKLLVRCTVLPLGRLWLAACPCLTDVEPPSFTGDPLGGSPGGCIPWDNCPLPTPYARTLSPKCCLVVGLGPLFFPGHQHRYVHGTVHGCLWAHHVRGVCIADKTWLLLVNSSYFLEDSIHHGLDERISTPISCQRPIGDFWPWRFRSVAGDFCHHRTNQSATTVSSLPVSSNYSCMMVQNRRAGMCRVSQLCVCNASVPLHLVPE